MKKKHPIETFAFEERTQRLVVLLEEREGQKDHPVKRPKPTQRNKQEGDDGWKLVKQHQLRKKEAGFWTSRADELSYKQKTTEEGSTDR